ncbi:MAG: bifunctional [glutamine synthetase] adenylyltransferase/[glutamine synthetase]-adenylyl-L-tyrosine phosphorylase, partial [Pseudonocardia sp.]|nr:bifunctional [glutamine synthetase] adenylyltransferase/[glutamine synthetase]-adenylyl-L-tyrosine phosphorylase [Pseudonocardia sp.]
MDRRTGTSLARLGITGPTAAETLQKLGWWSGDRPTQGAEEIMWALARSPDQELALRAVERLSQTPPWPEIDAALHTDPGLRGRLFATLGSSTALGDHLIAHPDSWSLLADTPDRRNPPPDLSRRTATLLRAVGADPHAPAPGSAGGARATLTGAEAVTALRNAYRDELLGLASADLAAVGDPSLPAMEVDDVAAQLADLAEAAISAAVAVAAAEQDIPDELRLAVIGMGKCGGRELNYVSDVDVIFVAEPGGDLTPAATKLAGRVMRVAGEACFEVDANLRPEGKQGALVRTLDGHVSYYQRWAKTWEFQALLKARPIAGDP